MEEDKLTGSNLSSTTNKRITYGEWLDQLCTYYMNCGVSCSEFWNGDYTYFHFYEEREKIRQKQENYYAWLHGAYVTEALRAVVGNMFRGKGDSPYVYPSEPYALGEDVEKVKEREIKKKEKSFKDQMIIFAEMHNLELNKNSKGGG